MRKNLTDSKENFLDKRYDVLLVYDWCFACIWLIIFVIEPLYASWVSLHNLHWAFLIFLPSWIASTSSKYSQTGERFCFSCDIIDNFHVFSWYSTSELVKCVCANPCGSTSEMRMRKPTWLQTNGWIAWYYIRMLSKQTNIRILVIFVSALLFC